MKDNGPGIPEDTIAGSLDFTIRASNREQYVAPDRGAQGNALMTLLSMPYVIDPENGRLVLNCSWCPTRDRLPGRSDHPASYCR